HDGLLGIRWQEWLGSTIPTPPTKSPARAGQLICRAADPKTAANDMHALMPRFLADGPAPGKARASGRGAEPGVVTSRCPSPDGPCAVRLLEVTVEFLRAHREPRNAQLKDGPAQDRQVKDRQVKDRQVTEREPLGSIDDIWTPATQMA